VADHGDLVRAWWDSPTPGPRVGSHEYVGVFLGLDPISSGTRGHEGAGHWQVLVGDGGGKMLRLPNWRWAIEVFS